MLHYHGTPMGMTDAEAALVLAGRHALVSWATPHPLPLVQSVCSSFVLDNGAFSAWRAGQPITDWDPYLRWVDEAARHPGFDFAIIPDVIDGSEADNDKLVRAWPRSLEGAPVFHLHESLARLSWLAREWPRVCLGSSGEYAEIGTDAWWRRIGEAMSAACDAEGRPLTKIHGLRMLDPAVFTRIPFASADSTNVARNAGNSSRWSGSYAPPTKAARGVVIAERIEAHQSPARWLGSPQSEFSLEVA
jgi:hypothetical protein